MLRVVAPTREHIGCRSAPDGWQAAHRSYLPRSPQPRITAVRPPCQVAGPELTLILVTYEFSQSRRQAWLYLSHDRSGHPPFIIGKAAAQPQGGAGLKGNTRSWAAIPIAADQSRISDPRVIASHQPLEG